MLKFFTALGVGADDEVSNHFGKFLIYHIVVG